MRAVRLVRISSIENTGARNWLNLGKLRGIRVCVIRRTRTQKIGSFKLPI